MKEPSEVKHMQETINNIYRKKKVRENYKNIETFPTVYDTNKKSESREGFQNRNVQEGFIKGFFSKSGWTRWKAPSVDPPTGNIEDIEFHPAKSLVKVFDKTNNMINFFSENEESLNSIFEFNKTKKDNFTFTLDSLAALFDDCPCIDWKKPFIFLPSEIIHFVCDLPPCMLNNFCKNVHSAMLSRHEVASKYDRETLTSFITEFMYIMIASYLAMMFFYYQILDTSSFVNPEEFVWKSGNKFFDQFIVGRLVHYLTFPITVFNMFFTDFIPWCTRILGVQTYSKLHFLFLFLLALGMVFNQLVENSTEWLKNSFDFEASPIIYMMTGIAVALKLFDLNVMFNLMETQAYQQFFYIYVPLVLILILIAFLLAPLTQMIFMYYVVNLFVLRPLSHLFEELTMTQTTLDDPASEASCNVPSGEFMGELNRFISGYIFPFLLPIMLLIFFVYRLKSSFDIVNNKLRMLVMLTNIACIVATVFYFVIIGMRRKLKTTVDINVEKEEIVKDPNYDTSGVFKKGNYATDEKYEPLNYDSAGDSEKNPKAYDTSDKNYSESNNLRNQLQKPVEADLQTNDTINYSPGEYSSGDYSRGKYGSSDYFKKEGYVENYLKSKEFEEYLKNLGKQDGVKNNSTGNTSEGTANEPDDPLSIDPSEINLDFPKNPDPAKQQP